MQMLERNQTPDRKQPSIMERHLNRIVLGLACWIFRRYVLIQNVFRLDYFLALKYWLEKVTMAVESDPHSLIKSAVSVRRSVFEVLLTPCPRVSFVFDPFRRCCRSAWIIPFESDTSSCPQKLCETCWTLTLVLTCFWRVELMERRPVWLIPSRKPETWKEGFGRLGFSNSICIPSFQRVLKSVFPAFLPGKKREKKPNGG